MDSLKDINLDKHVSILACNEIAEICRPLFKQFGLNYFSYLKLYTNGSASILNSSAPFLKTIINSNLTAGSDVAAKFKTGYYFWDDIDASLPNKTIGKIREQVTNAREYFNIYDCFMIVEQTSKHWTNIYDFGAPKNNPYAKNFYINNYDSLHYFINYFKDKATTLLSIVNANKLPIYTPITQPKQQKQKAFRQETKLRHLHLEDYKYPPLNRRELECLSYTLHGQTASEISTKLNISPKTVEGYISNVKHKLNCKKRSELFQKAIKLKLIKIARFF